jgi:hypothetical protein
MDFIALCKNIGCEPPKIFFETGLYKGEGVEKCIGYFDHVVSCDIVKEFCDKAEQKFKTIPSVTILHGDSKDCLKKSLEWNQPIFFYLDAHFSGGKTGGEDLYKGCPVLEELKVLGQRSEQDLILIDDMRLMGKASVSGTLGDETYPLTYFDFRHATVDNMLASYNRDSFIFKIKNQDRILLVPKLKKNIHTIGDSHCINGFKDIPSVSTNHIGAVLAYSFGLNKLEKVNLKTLPPLKEIKEGDTVIFCFGEIDCRCHVYKHGGIECIDSIVSSYFEAIKQNEANFNSIKIAVFNVVPPVKKENTEENKEYPYLGTDLQRKSYVLYFNERLKEYCSKYNYIYFDVYDKYVDEEGFLNKKLSDGNVHISDSTFLREFIESNLV